MDKYRETEACGSLKTIRSMTIREKLEMRISDSEMTIKRAEENRDEAKAALLLLKKNSELETLINLINK